MVPRASAVQQRGDLYPSVYHALAVHNEELERDLDGDHGLMRGRIVQGLKPVGKNAQAYDFRLLNGGLQSPWRITIS